MTSVTSEITNMQNQTAFYKLAQDKQNAASRTPKTENDSNVFFNIDVETARAAGSDTADR